MYEEIIIDNPITDSRLATVMISTAITNPVKLLTEEATIKKVKKTERSIISIIVKSKMMFVQLIIIPNTLTVKRMNGNTSKEYITLIIDLHSFIH